MFKKKKFIVTLILVVLGLGTLALSNERQVKVDKLTPHTLMVQGRERSYLVYTPFYLSKGEADEHFPVVIALHGGGGPMGSAEMMAQVSGWPEKAEQERFITVFPNGTPHDPSKPTELKGNIQEWNDGTGRSYAEKLGVDDVAFIQALIDDLMLKYPVDSKRIFVTGFSNGASLSLYLGVKLANRIAAIAPVAGVLSTAPSATTSPVSLLYISGSLDKRPQLPDTKQPQSLKNPITAWTQALKCSSDPVVATSKDNIRTASYASCRGGAKVVSYTIPGMGHVYPGAQTELWEEGADNPANDLLNATNVIWGFLKKVGTSE